MSSSASNIPLCHSFQGQGVSREFTRVEISCARCTISFLNPDWRSLGRRKHICFV